MFPTLAAAAVILVIGLIDDRVGLKASWKFLGQLLGVLIYVTWGSRIEFVSNPFGGMFYLSWLSIPVTIFWFLALINLMNFIDGLDGSL